MMDISARELKGHNILAVERFWDNTRWMIEFSVLRPSTAYGSPGEEMRLFLTEDGYQAALQSQQRREIKIKRYARVIEGHILDFKPGKRRRSYGFGCGGIPPEADESRPPEQAVSSGGPAAQILPGGD